MLVCHAKDLCHVKVVKTTVNVMLFPQILVRANAHATKALFHDRASQDHFLLDHTLLSRPYFVLDVRKEKGHSGGLATIPCC